MSSFFPQPFVSNCLAYMVPGDPRVRLFTNRTASIVDTQATAAAAGALTDGTVITWADKYTGCTMNNDFNDQTTRIIATSPGTVSHVYVSDGAPSNAATLPPQTIVYSTAFLQPVLSTGNANNVGVTNTYNRIIPTTTGNFAVTGFAGGVNGMLIVVSYTGTDNMTIANNSSSSASGNKIFTSTGADVATTGRGCFNFIYDATADSGNGGWIQIAPVAA